MKTLICGYSLVFKWSGPWTFTVEGLDSIPGWGTKIPQAEAFAPPSRKTPPKFIYNSTWVTKWSTREYSN